MSKMTAGQLIAGNYNGARRTLSVDDDGSLLVSATAEIAAEATAAAPTYTEGQNAPLSQDLSGNLRTIGALPTGASTSAAQTTAQTSLTLIASAIRNEDSASADADPGIALFAVRKATPANTSGTDGDYEALQISAGRLWTSQVRSPSTPTASQISCTSSSTTLWSAVATGQIVEVFNNGIYPIWIRSDNGAPVADTATYPASNGNGLGIMVQPASYWNSDIPITTGGKGIALSTASLITVQLYPN